jgi:glycolate oxidase FAD binding subunit
MALSAAALADAFADAVGREHLHSDPDTLARHAVMGLTPRWVAAPGSVEEVSRLLSVASEECMAVIPMGSGSALPLGNVPSRADLVISFARMNGVIDYAPDDLTVKVQAGLTLASLSGTLAPHRQLLPLDPLEGGGRTVGGVVATGASGPLRFRYGSARDLLLGVRFVQADGTVTWGGANVVKSVTGYDVPKLMVGSLGTLGLIVEMTLRLHPLPEAEGTWLALFARREAAASFILSVLDSTLQPNRLELLNSRALAALGQGSGTVGVAVSFGSVAEAVRSQGESLSEFARRSGGEVRAAVEPDFWFRLGRMILPRSDDGEIRISLATLPSALLDALDRVETLGAERRLEVVAVGEAGNGLLHARIRGADPAEKWTPALISSLRDKLAREGGNCVVESAPKAVLERLDAWGPVEEKSFAVMSSLKSEFDPRGILNPGRFIGRL